MVHKNCILSYLLKIPNWLLAICGAIVCLYHQSLSLIPIGVIIIKFLISPTEWQIKPKQTLLKFTIAIIIFERIFIGAANNWYWEYSRGGAKFHFEDFSKDIKMQEYFNRHYPLGSDANQLVYDIETANGQCEKIIDYKDAKDEKFHYFCEKKGSKISLVFEWIVVIYIDDHNIISNIKPYINDVHI